MVTELLSKPKQSRQHLELDIELSNMGVTDEDAQMDLHLYIRNFDLKSIFFFAEPDGEKQNVNQKHTDVSIRVYYVLDLMESQKKHK